MKKLAMLALIIAMTAMMLIPVNAVHFNPGAYDDFASDDATLFDEAAVYIWLDDGTAICYNGSSYTADTDDGHLTGEAIVENDIANIRGTWYEWANCGIGSEDDSAYPADLDGKIALIQRGEHTFTIKSEGAKRNGAVGTIIYNNHPAEELVDDDGTILTYADFGMSIDYATTPVASISSDIGDRIANSYTGKIFIGTKAEYDQSLLDIAAAAEAEAAAAAAAEAEAAAAAAAAEAAAVVAEAAPVVTTAAQTGDLLVLGLVGLAGAVVALKKRH